MSAASIAQAVRRGKRSAETVVREAVARAKASGDLNAFTQVLEPEAMARAAAIDAAVGRGEDAGALAGVPIAVKDNLCTSQGRTTCASRFLEGYRSPFTATCVARLEAAGAVVIGKTNLDEFAMGSSGEHSAFGATRNPWDPRRAPGGSSSGSAAAVGAGIVPLALGSDTGGSIRQPASHCGVVGMKPTYGVVSRYGLVAFASSLDQVGPMATRVEDVAMALEVMRGEDPLDATSSRHDTGDLVSGVGSAIEGARIGVPRDVLDDAELHDGVRDVYERAIESCRSMGAEVVDIELPNARSGIAAYYIVAPAEASSNLARFDGVRYGRRAELDEGEGLEALYVKSRTEGFGAEVRRRILLGTHVLSSGYYDAYYTKALKARRLIKGDYDRAFGERGCDAVLAPVAEGPAFELGSKSEDPLALYLEDVFTVGVNLAGLPGITLPAGTAREDGVELPVGVQLIGGAFGDARLLRLASMLEAALGWGGRVAG
ncbi:MAG: Asp-tRNA(Asn)/Glu-tRNA(Gln) amidotransferase subunit GatA [Planctomycetota bacterium]